MVPKKEKQNIPSGWRLTSLGSLATKLKTGGTPTSTNKAFYDGEIPFVKIDDMTTNGKYISSTRGHISEEGLKNSSAWLVPKGSILYSIYATVGEVSINSIDVATNQAIMGIVVDEKKVTRDYLYQYLLSIKPSLRRYFKETTQKNLTSQIVKELEVSIPESTKEQQKIAEILGAVDEDITKTQEVIQATEKLKRGLMQQLFTRGIGHTKFKETKIGKIPDEWVVSELGKVCDVRDGTHRSPKYHEEGYPLITSKNLVDSGLDFDNVSLISETDFKEIERRSEVDNGDILFGMIGTIGNPVIVKKERDFAIKNVALIKFNKSEMDNVFVLNFLKSTLTEKQFNQKKGGSTQKFIALGVIRQILITIPSKSEQKEIADILSAVDEKISVNKKFKEKLTLLKKGLMQDLLSGKVRTT